MVFAIATFHKTFRTNSLIVTVTAGYTISAETVVTFDTHISAFITYVGTVRTMITFGTLIYFTAFHTDFMTIGADRVIVTV